MSDHNKTPNGSDDESGVSDTESIYDADADADADQTVIDEDLSQDLTVEDAVEFTLEEPDDMICDYEVLEHLDTDSDGDNESHIVSKSATIHTTEYITKYEKTRVLGWRAQHIKSGASPMIRKDEKDPNGVPIFPGEKYPREPYDIALKELQYGRCPVIIARRFPNGEKVMVRVSKLKLI